MEPINKKKQGRKSIRCYYCRKYVHKIGSCRIRKRKNSSFSVTAGFSIHQQLIAKCTTTAVFHHEEYSMTKFVLVVLLNIIQRISRRIAEESYCLRQMKTLRHTNASTILSEIIELGMQLIPVLVKYERILDKNNSQIFVSEFQNPGYHLCPSLFLLRKTNPSSVKILQKDAECRKDSRRGDNVFLKSQVGIPCMCRMHDVQFPRFLKIEFGS